MRSLIPTILLSLLAAVLAPAASAQCTPVPNTGCPGANAPNCSGSTQIGSQITISCLNNGRAAFNFVIVGACEQPPAMVPQFLACTTAPCTLGVSIATAVSVPNAFTPITIPIPNAPNLIGLTLCTQCADFIVTTAPCLSFGQAASLTITP